MQKEDHHRIDDMENKPACLNSYLRIHLFSCQIEAAVGACACLLLRNLSLHAMCFKPSS